MTETITRDMVIALRRWKRRLGKVRTCLKKNTVIFDRREVEDALDETRAEMASWMTRQETL